MRVKEVYYSTGFDLTFDEWFPGVYDQWSPDAAAISGRLEGISLFENPSIWTQYTQRLEQYEKMFDGTFEYDPQTKLLRLIPMPSSDGKIIPYIWTQRHTAETIPEEDIDDMLMWAKGMAKESMANKKSDQIRSVSGFGQSITMGATYETLLKDATDLKDRFEKKFRGGMSIHIA